MTIDSVLLGNAIKKIRILRGFTSEQLAREINLSKGFISLIENGHRCPSFETLNKIGKALQVPPVYIVMLGTELPEKEDELTLYLKVLKKLVECSIER